MSERIRVLVVDDDEMFRQTIARELGHMGFRVTAVDGGEQALAQFRENWFDVTLLDIRMPKMDGLAVLNEIRTGEVGTEVVMLTGHGSVEDAVEAMKLGAYHYLVKPCPLEELEATVRKAAEKGQLARQNALFAQEISRREAVAQIVGASPAIRSVMDMIGRVAPSDSTILIHGESGVGKEVVARALHKASHRATGPFVVIDCTALQESLLESELFGHERGAYTGATSLKHGLFEVADSGTILLDEVSEISPAIQAKLLRVLETGTFRRVGGTRGLEVDVRTLAATNRNLEDLVTQGAFRKDLFFRLNVVSLLVPPLRSRREDVPLLARHFIDKSAPARPEPLTITAEALEVLKDHNWPGNVRELQNVIERAVLLCKGNQVSVEDLPEGLRAGPRPMVDEGGDLPSLKEAEHRYIAQVLGSVNGHRGKAARILGISERQLYRKLREGGAGGAVTDPSGTR